MDTSDREPEPILDKQAEPTGLGAVTWTWGKEEDRRPQIPWIGIFILIYGLLLLVRQAMPEALTAANLALVAAGLAFLIVWFLRRSTFALYAGAFLTAAALPGLVESAGYNSPPGLGTLCYGLALLGIALVRSRRGGGIGWQALLGAALAALGASEIAVPDAAGYLLPIVLILLGAMLLLDSRNDRPAGGRGMFGFRR